MPVYNHEDFPGVDVQADDIYQAARKFEKLVPQLPDISKVTEVGPDNPPDETG